MLLRQSLMLDLPGTLEKSDQQILAGLVKHCVQAW
jgi:hypothetical protein